jgi:hypothetical protein
MLLPRAPHPNNLGRVGASWHDTSDTDTIIAGGGDGVSQHRDKTGNAEHRNQPTEANQPETGLDTINGHNVFRYTATSHMFFRADNYLSFGDFTIFHAAKTDINGAGSEPEPHYISIRRPGGNFSSLFNILTQQPIRDIGVRWSTSTTGAGTPGSAITTNVPFLTVVKLVRNQAQGLIRVNGATLASGFTYAPIEDDQPEIIWGSNFAAPNLGDFDGNEIENLIFPWALELYQIKFIENYYRNRYLLW